MRVMLYMLHGLGDQVTFGVVLQHLQVFRPDWEITVECKPEWASVYKGLCAHTAPAPTNWEHTRYGYDKAFYMQYGQPTATYAGIPSTKPTVCLQEVFRIKPCPLLYRYLVRPEPQHVQMAKTFVDGREVALIHYQGVSSPHRKNLTHEQAGQLVDKIKAQGLVPILIDYDNKSPLVCERVPSGCRDPATLTAIMGMAKHVYAIDSGPLHLAAATTTPTTAYWYGWWVGHNIDPSDNVTNMIAPTAFDYIHGDKVAHMEYFNRKYRWQEWDGVAV